MGSPAAARAEFCGGFTSPPRRATRARRRRWAWAARRRPRRWPRRRRGAQTCAAHGNRQSQTSRGEAALLACATHGAHTGSSVHRAKVHGVGSAPCVVPCLPPLALVAEVERLPPADREVELLHRATHLARMRGDVGRDRSAASRTCGVRCARGCTAWVVHCVGPWPSLPAARTHLDLGGEVSEPSSPPD